MVPSQTSHDTATTAAAATSHDTALTAAAVAALVPALPVWEFNGVQLTKLTPSKVTVTTELERLVPILMQKQDRAQTEGTSLSRGLYLIQSTNILLGVMNTLAPRMH